MAIPMTTEAIYWSAVRGKYLLEISLLMTTEASPLSAYSPIASGKQHLLIGEIKCKSISLKTLVHVAGLLMLSDG